MPQLLVGVTPGGAQALRDGVLGAGAHVAGRLDPSLPQPCRLNGSHCEWNGCLLCGCLEAGVTDEQRTSAIDPKQPPASHE